MFFRYYSGGGTTTCFSLVGAANRVSDAPLSAKVPGYSRRLPAEAAAQAGRRGLSTSATPSSGGKNMGQDLETRFFSIKKLRKI